MSWQPFENVLLKLKFVAIFANESLFSSAEIADENPDPKLWWSRKTSRYETIQDYSAEIYPTGNIRLNFYRVQHYA